MSMPPLDFGRPVSRVARELGKHPSWLIRAITKGTVSRDGTRRRCAATRVGGRWHVRDDDIREFVAAITADRLELPTKPTAAHGTNWRRREVEQAEAELTAAGI